jgi:prolyl-tRNA synthetase
LRRSLTQQGIGDDLPLVTTEELFGREAQHIKGFSPEVFVIESAGGKPLEVKLIVRPTSETIMYPMFRLWIRSHADLPLLSSKQHGLQI